MLVLSAAAGNTGWHHMINRREGAQELPGYAAVAGGHTFPAAASWHRSELVFAGVVSVLAGLLAVRLFRAVPDTTQA